MHIVIYGETDKRPVIYTLLKLLQSLGDVALITTDRHFKRLTDGLDTGELEGIFISVGDYTPDDVFSALDMDVDDFEFVLYDGTIPEDHDSFIYVAGCNQSEEERDTLEYIDNPSTLSLGYGKNCIPYSVNMFKNIEEIEGFKSLKEVDPNVTKQVASIMAPILNMPANTIRKVVAKKR